MPVEPSQTTRSVQATYDEVARAYDAAIADELAGKPLDRALLDAVLELAGPGTVADVGCGPGHVTRYLAARHPDVVGIDLSPAMIDVARDRAPELGFAVGSMLALPVQDGAWAAAVALYSVIHFDDRERLLACHELYRAVRPGGWVLVAFHVDSADFAAGQTYHATSWFGADVALDFYYLDPAVVTADLRSAGFEMVATLQRQGQIQVEHPSRRCYLLARRP